MEKEILFVYHLFKRRKIINIRLLDDKNIIVVDKNTSKKDVTGRLLVEKIENIGVCNVDDERKIDGKLWLEYILDNIDKTIV